MGAGRYKMLRRTRGEGEGPRQPRLKTGAQLPRALSCPQHFKGFPPAAALCAPPRQAPS